MKDKLFKKAIAWAEKKGFKEIKANTDEFETPSALKTLDEDIVIIPDITAKSLGNKSYIEIALKEDDKQQLISKWKLFCTLAARKGGKLYLLAARGHKTFADRIVKEYNLPHTKVVSI